jgi:hypothetical protein
VLAADEVQQVREGLWCWQRFQPSVKVDCTSTAFRVGTQLIFVDPIPLAPEALAELTSQAEPAAIVVTNGNHDRAASQLCSKFKIPVIAHTAAIAELGFAADQTVSDDEVLLDALRVIHAARCGRWRDRAARSARLADSGRRLDQSRTRRPGVTAGEILQPTPPKCAGRCENYCGFPAKF